MKYPLGFEPLPKDYVRPVRCISAYDFIYDTSMDLEKFDLDDPFKSRIFRWFFKNQCIVHRDQVLVFHDVKYIGFVMEDYNLRTNELKCKLLFCSYWPTLHKLRTHGIDADGLFIVPAPYACKYIDV